MQRSVSTASSADAWVDLVDAVQGKTAERAVLRDLLGILASELEASAAKLLLGEGDPFPQLVVRLGTEARAGETLTVPVQGGVVRFEGVPAGSSPRLDPQRLTALGIAVRAFGQSEDVKRRQFEVNYRGVEREALYDVGLAIAATLNLEELSEEILLRAVSLLDARRGAFFRRSGEKFELAQTFGGDAAERVSTEELESLLAGRPAGKVDVLPGSPGTAGSGSMCRSG